MLETTDRLQIPHPVVPNTVKNILREAGVKPSPERGPGSGTWNDFLKAHVDSLWQIDFFSKLIWTPTGLRQAFVLAFLHVGTRRVFCSPCSFQPTEKWMVSQAHACIEQAREAGLDMSYLIHDRDGMYIRDFDQVFKDSLCRFIKMAPQAPNQQAFVERWVKSIQDECLNHFIVFGKKHFDYLLSSYLAFYNTARPQQGIGIGNKPLTGDWFEVEESLAPSERIVCVESLGGILKHYEQRAA